MVEAVLNLSARKHHVALRSEQRSHGEKMARSNQASIRERVDGESTREGTAALFMECELLAGQRHVFVRAQRQHPDLAAVSKALCEELHAATRIDW